MFDPNAMLSQHYSLGDLTQTSQMLMRPNFPENVQQFDNLTYLADILERLNHEIGPFQILSGFRTKELQSILAGQGEPVASGISFHEVGRGVDITPTSMSTAEYFGLILAIEDLKNQFAEIAIKPSQNAIHLAINVPGDVREPKITGLNSEGVYARLTLDEIANYLSPFVESVDEAYYAASKLVTQNRIPLIIGMVAAAGGVIYLMLASGKHDSGRRVL